MFIPLRYEIVTKKFHKVIFYKKRQKATNINFKTSAITGK